MENDFLKIKIKQQFDEIGNNMYSTNAEYIINGINTITDDIIPININTLERGKFYFIFYDLQGKSSKMEKFNPLFIIDFINKNNSKYVYGVSINFLPITIRTLFFNNICNYNKKIFEQNEKIKTLDQYALENINFANIYKLLYNIGFEWSIREFDLRTINKIYSISTNIIDRFITMSTYKLTGVDDLKLIEIWNKKINEQEKRHNELMNSILNDYKQIDNELKKTYTTLETKNDNLEKSISLIKKIF